MALPAAPVPARRPSILVVEEDASVADMVVGSLVRLEFHVVGVCSRGEDAVTQASRDRPDMVLVDLALRGGLDGVATAQAIRAGSGCAVVYLIGHADEARLSRARATDPYGFVFKPFTQEELKTTLENALYKHRIQQQLLERERFFSTMLTSIADAVIATDAGLRVTFINPRGEELVGLGSAEALGRPLADVYRVLDAETREPDLGPVEKALARRAPAAGLAARVLATPHGTEVAVDDSAAPIMDAQGLVVGVVVVFRDVGEQKSLEKRLAITERLVSLGTLAAGIAHEINNPMAYVVTNLGYSSRALDQLRSQLVAERGSALPEALEKTLNDVQAALRESLEGAERVRRIVADVKTFSRPETDATRPLNVHDALETAIKLVAHQLPDHARVERDYQAVPLVQANESRLGQLFLNLLMNAAESHEGPGQQAPHKVSIRTRPLPADCVLVEVTDNGVGIATENLGRVFDPFFTTKPGGGGTGLGLPICHRIVMDLAGDIMVDSQPGRGTTLRVILPGRQGTFAHPPSLKRRVVVVAPLLSASAQEALAEVGADVAHAPTVHEALSMLHPLPHAVVLPGPDRPPALLAALGREHARVVVSPLEPAEVLRAALDALPAAPTA